MLGRVTDDEPGALNEELGPSNHQQLLGGTHRRLLWGEGSMAQYGAGGLNQGRIEDGAGRRRTMWEEENYKMDLQWEVK